MLFRVLLLTMLFEQISLQVTKEAVVSCQRVGPQSATVDRLSADALADPSNGSASLPNRFFFLEQDTIDPLFFQIQFNLLVSDLE